MEFCAPQDFAAPRILEALSIRIWLTELHDHRLVIGQASFPVAGYIGDAGFEVCADEDVVAAMRLPIGLVGDAKAGRMRLGGMRD